VTIRPPKNDASVPVSTPTSRGTAAPAQPAQAEPARTGLRRWEAKEVPGRLTGETGFDAGKPNTVRANVLATPSGGGVPAPGSYPTPTDVDRIAGMKDPVERNYAITQGYHDLSNALGDLLGRENANWSTFGVWASKQAGSTIRKEDAPELIVKALDNHEGVTKALDGVNKVLKGVGLPTIPNVGELLGKGDKLMDTMSSAIADGNREVFAEIGREFSVFVETFKGDTQYDQKKVDAYLAHFKPEQKGLRDAFSNYAKAMFEKDPNKKAELMLLGNNQIGLHEQTNLQKHVARALDAPTGIIKDTLKDAIRTIAEKAGPFGTGKLAFKALEKSGALDKVLNPLADAAGAAFRRGATEFMMKLGLPNGQNLSLGDDLPGPGGKKSFPSDLSTIENPELRQLLQRLDKTPDTLNGSAAKDWKNLDERMNFIIDLFRSYQKDPSLWNSPFGKTVKYSQPGVS
jgi:hypothetical protein